MALQRLLRGNFYPDRLVDLVAHHDVVPAVNQVETHPFFQRSDYQQLMADHGVPIESWARPPKAATTSSPTRPWPLSPPTTARASPRSRCGG
jgi:diketogulonate reductase-like aldo/keto reductase